MRRKLLGLSLVLLAAAALRFWNLATPGELVFDEVYYVDGARDYLSAGVEVSDGKPEFVVHPPLGKWAIAAGIAIGGDNSFGWRISSALAGTLAIGLIFLVARRLFGSYPIALGAAILSSVDGLHLVMSRTALLDIFLALFLLAAFLALLYEQHFLTALALGAALATKWSAAYFIVAIGVYLLVKARRELWKYLVTVPSLYLISWSGWFLSDKGWARDSNSNPLLALWNYHREILGFHTGLTEDHSYEASPWNWLLLGRPTSFFYASPKTCGAESCSQEILALGTPFLWWGGAIAIAVTIGYFISRRERVAGLILLALGANFLPWLLFPERTTFYFYAIAFQPFLILAICYVATKFLEAPETRLRRQQIAISALGLVTICFLYFLPIYIGSVLTYDAWYARMWLTNWI